MKRNFFYKELTPAEVGNTGTHEVYVRLPNNFDHESFFGHSAIMNGSVMEVNFKALDITNGGKETVSLRFAYFINSNQEKRIPSLGPLFRSHNVKEGDIAYLESMINGTSITYKICFYKKGEIQINPSSIYFTQIERDSNIVSGLQQIFYGAPGTGKSHEIKEKTAAAEEAGRVIRTTFHPDSDYSTFVGAYKPTMSSSEKIYSADELITKLKEIKNTGTTYPCHKFSSKYWESLKDLSANEIKQILAACGFTEAYGVEVAKGVAIGQEYLNKRAEGKIIYAFVPQAFTKAYTTAWNTVEKVYLIIEEINRGNCAQIFGDLFQLLDRKAGFSEYPVDADSDLANHICEELKNSSRTDFPEGVKEGKKLVLPSNLYIWATMNTSDQSLFPIDSAFKRRWDWKYIPINPEKENWSIETSKGLFSWSSFLNEINREIGETTSSEDKKLGFYFCKAESDKISAEKFVSKVLFYVYNDVFKDYGFESKDFFKKNGKVMYFQDYYNVDGTINEENVIQFLKNLEVVFKENDDEQEDDIDEDGIGGNSRHKHLTTVVCEDGEVFDIADMTRFQVYLETLKKIGLDRVEPVLAASKYRRVGCPLVSKQQYDVILNSTKYRYIKEGDYYIIKGMSDDTKIAALKYLNEQLNFGLTINYN